jgi:hypothetical protein
VNGRERCRLREEAEGWVLAIDGHDRLALPTQDGSGPYIQPELRAVRPDS